MLNEKSMARARDMVHDAIGGEYCIYGKSLEVRKICDVIKKVAATGSTVIILGESGTGKELVASALHKMSKRSDGPFVKVNCAALNDNLLESELFGHSRGSFTGAVAERAGKFEAASGGTIFLDEVGDISQAMQSKLLRVLQEKTFERVGENKTRVCDVRVVAATHRDLKKMVDEGSFRLDLYYRLNVVTVYLPSLKERRDDIPGLVHYFIKKYNERENASVKSVTPEVMKRLSDHSWPGNVRELENVIEEACVMADGDVIEAVKLPDSPATQSAGSGRTEAAGGGDAGSLLERRAPAPFGSANRIVRGTITSGDGMDCETPRAPVMKPGPGAAADFMDIELPCTLEDAEIRIIRKTLELTAGNRTRAAKLLGISLRSLQMKLKKIL